MILAKIVETCTRGFCIISAYTLIIVQIFLSPLPPPTLFNVVYSIRTLQHAKTRCYLRPNIEKGARVFGELDLKNNYRYWVNWKIIAGASKLVFLQFAYETTVSVLSYIGEDESVQNDISGI